MQAAHRRGANMLGEAAAFTGPAGQRLTIDRIAAAAGGTCVEGSLTGAGAAALSIGIEAGPIAQYRPARISDGRFMECFALPPLTQGRATFSIDSGRPQSSWTAAAQFDVRHCVAPWRRLFGFYRFFWTAIVPRAFDFIVPARRQAARQAISKLLDIARFGAPEGPIDARRCFAARAAAALPADCMATVIVPVYNGHRHVKALLGDLRRSLPAPHRLVIIDDASRQPEIARLLAAAMRGKEFAGRIDILRNQENRGFVASANRGLGLAKGHAILLNSDVRLPPAWIDRLLAPILADSSVASVTPFSNAATICSFPKIAADNAPLADIALDRIDRHFRALDRACIEFDMPTGVGFCMAMNRRFIDAIGLFDAAAFGRGYGEENDWCQRAIAAGGRNVMAPDLYVLHAHGGSFGSAERQALIARNLLVLGARHGNYHADVRRFFAADPARTLRAMLLFRILAHEAGSDFEIIVDHEMGGGSNLYRERRIAARAGRKASSALVTGAAKEQGVSISFRHGGNDYGFRLPAWDHFDVLLPDRARIHWVLNSAVGMARLSQCLDYMAARTGRHGNRLTICLHDYYPVCPSYNLLDREGRYCGVPDLAVCARCLPSNSHAHHAAVISDRGEWRAAWSKALAAADEITAFSAASAAIFLKAYPRCKDRLAVRPHGKPKGSGRLAALPARLKPGETVKIGVVGAIGYSKGAEVTVAAAKAIAAGRLPAKIAVIGKLAPGYSHPGIEFHGAFRSSDLPAILRQRGIHVAWVPSIWPETYCYVVDELMAAGVPLACFDLGAPPERVRTYKRGLVLADLDAYHAVNQLIAHARRFM
ncbi:MAG: glycosyltransferase [Hyphomicrobiales bacterium]